MMKALTTTLSGLLLLAASLPAFARHCPVDMREIDAALADNPSVSASDLKRIKELRASGENYHKVGKHGQSVEDLHEAMRLLGLEVK